MTPIRLFVLFLLTVMAALPAAAANRLAATVTPSAVVFSGVTHGGELVLFAASIGMDRGTLQRGRFTEVLADADGDGVVTYEPKRGIPFRSVWAGVDLQSGSIAVAAPEGYELQHSNVLLGKLKNDGDGLPAALEVDRFSVHVLLVRPGKGAWLYMGAQGGAKDRGNGRDGLLTAFFEDAKPIVTKHDKAPKQLRKGDVIAVLDPSQMDLRTWTVTN